MSENYYTVLQVERSATQKEIKTAFRRLAHEHHPDKGGDEKKFKKINEAYQTLSSEEKRKQYDTFGQTRSGFSGTGNTQYAQYYSQFAGGNPGFNVNSLKIKKIPLMGWVLLLPFIVLIMFIGFIVILSFALRTLVRVASR